MQLFVMTLTGRSYTIDVEPTDLIESVTDKIKEKTGLEGEIFVIFGGKKLESHRTVSECGVGKEDTVRIFARPRRESDIAVSVETEAGKIIRLQLSPGDSISSVKAKIQSEEGVLPDLQKLGFEGDILEDDRTISHYNIRNGSTLQLKIEGSGDKDDCEDHGGFTGTISEKWDRSISDPELEYTDEDATAKRPGGASNYPASMVSVPTGPVGSFALTAVLTSAPPSGYAMSFGIARRGFKMNHSSGFGDSRGSWGITEGNRSGSSGGSVSSYGGSSKEQKTTFRKMKEGDVFCLRYERVLGRAWLYINKTELVQEFKIHEPGESPDLVVGATYCANHVLKIVAEGPPDLPPAAEDELQTALEDAAKASGGAGSAEAGSKRKKSLAPMLTASLEGNLEEVTALVATGEDVNVADKQGWTPLGNAARKGYVEIIRLLLEAAADVSKINSNGWTPIFAAARNGRVAAVKVLLEAGALLDPGTKIVFNKEVATSEQQAQVHELLYSMRFAAASHQCAAQLRSWWRDQPGVDSLASPEAPDTEMVVRKLQELVGNAGDNRLQPRDAVFVFVSGTFDQSLLMERAERQIAQHAAVLLQLASSEELQRHLIASFGWLLSVKYPYAEGRFSVVLKALYDESLVDEEALQDWYCAAKRDERSALSLIPASSLEALLQSAAPLLAWLQEAEEGELAP